MERFLDSVSKFLIIVATWMHAIVPIDDRGLVLLYRIRFSFVLPTLNKGHIWSIYGDNYGLDYDDDFGKNDS